MNKCSGYNGSFEVLLFIYIAANNPHRHKQDALNTSIKTSTRIHISVQHNQPYVFFIVLYSKLIVENDRIRNSRSFPGSMHAYLALSSLVDFRFTIWSPYQVISLVWTLNHESEIH